MRVNGVVFEPLPQRAARSADPSYGLADVLSKLRERPDEWARVMEQEKPQKLSYIAKKVNSGRMPPFRQDFAACVRRLPTGQHALYMRYVGEEGGA